MAARVGVLSDAAIKQHCPEFFPTDMRTTAALKPLNLQTHPFKGIRIPRETQTETHSRFPINDIQNFASIAAPSRYQEASMEAVYRYRETIGSDNVPSDISAGYKEQMKSTFKPRSMTSVGSSSLSAASTDIADLSSLTHTPASLVLGIRTKKEGMELFDAEMSGGRAILDPRSRALISNIATKEDFGSILDIIFPGGINPRSGRITHGEVVSKLNKEYQSDREALSIIAKADSASKRRGVVPERGNLLAYMTEVKEEKLENDE